MEEWKIDSEAVEKDYIHYNPVKHGQVTRVADWPYSSFYRFVERGIYNLDWAADDNVRSLEME